MAVTTSCRQRRLSPCRLSFRGNVLIGRARMDLIRPALGLWKRAFVEEGVPEICGLIASHGLPRRSKTIPPTYCLAVCPRGLDTSQDLLVTQDSPGSGPAAIRTAQRKAAEQGWPSSKPIASETLQQMPLFLTQVASAWKNSRGLTRKSGVSRHAPRSAAALCRICVGVVPRYYRVARDNIFHRNRVQEARLDSLQPSCITGSDDRHECAYGHHRISDQAGQPST